MSPIRKRFFNAIGKYIIGRVGFQYERCAGVSESELTKSLFPNTGIIPNTAKCMFFLRDVDISHSNIIKQLLGVMKDGGGYGNLVISTDNLPQELLGQFEIIELEAEKQDTAQEAIELKYDTDKHILFTSEKYFQLTRDKKILIQCLFEGRKKIDLLSDKIAQNKGKNIKQDTQGNCRKLITKTNEVIEKEFGVKDFINNERNKSGFYCLTPRPKEGIFQR